MPLYTFEALGTKIIVGYFAQLFNRDRLLPELDEHIITGKYLIS
jgi:hypothetical protein